MQQDFTRKPFILALHDDHAPTLRELRDEEAQRVGGGQAICMTDSHTLLVTPGCEGTEWICDDE
jgi:hypothetical protein